MPRKRLTEESVRKLKPPPVKLDSKGRPTGSLTIFDTGLTGLILNVSYGGKKTWRCIHYTKKNSKTIGRTAKLGEYPELSLKDARDAARQFLDNPQAAIAKAAPDSFEAVKVEFLKRHVAKEKLRSQPEIERCFNKYLVPHFKDRPFVEIKRSEITKFLDKIEDENGPRQADLILSLMRKMSNWYATRSDSYVPPIVKGMRRQKPSKQARKRALDDNEIRAIWAKAPEIHPTFGAIVRFALLTAQRRSKIATMRWEDIEDGEWTIAMEENEKENAGLLRLPQLARDIIAAQPKIVGNPYVFAAGKGVGNGKAVGPFNSFGQRCAELDEALPLPSWTIHDLRRTARSLMARAGVSSDHAERTLGHKLIGVEGTYNRYDFLDEKSEALQRLASLIETILNPPDNSNVVKLKR